MNAKTARRALLILSSPQFGFDRDARPERENNLRMEPVFIATRYNVKAGGASEGRTNPEVQVGSYRVKRAGHR